MTKPKPDHVHSYRRNRKKKNLYYCTKYGCRHYLDKELLRGKRVVCPVCGAGFVADSYALKLALPICEDCRRQKSSPQQKEAQKVAAENFQKLAEQGQVDAQFYLGGMYLKGLGVPQDRTEAVHWFRRAAEQGHVDAQFNLGKIFLRGVGVPQDHAEAARFFRKAAAHGHVDAQFHLGEMYEAGKGVPQDYVQSHMWFNLAAARATGESRKESANARDLIAQKMNPAMLAEAEERAREWALRPAEAEQN